MEYRSQCTVELAAHCGTDDGIIRDAMVLRPNESHGKDPGRFLLALMRARHGSPFEHNHFKFVVEAPIFVFREWHRHRIGWSYNEISARYRPLQPVFWVPGDDRPIVESPQHNPMRPTLEVSPATAGTARTMLTNAYAVAWETYETMLACGVAKEIARACLPVGIYSRMVCSCNVRSLLHYLSLRTHDPDARFVSYPQAEIEECARRIEALFAGRFPHTHAAFVKCGRVAP